VKTSTQREKLDKAYAYHEAGHAVVAWDQGLRIHRGTIHADGNSPGHVLHSWGVPAILFESGSGQSLRTAVERNVRAALAGEVAQRRAAPKSIRSFDGAGDRENIADLLVALHGYNNERINVHQRLLVLETEGIVDRWWHCVEAVAQLLLDRRTVPGRDIRAAIFAANMAAAT